MKQLAYILTIGSLFSFAAAHAQEDGKDKTFDEEVDIVKPYKPKLSDAIKIDVVPVQENIESPKPDIKYSTTGSLLDLQPVQIKLKAPQLGRPKLDELHHNYAKLGFGNYSNVYAEYFYNTLRNRNSLLALSLKHHSGKGPVDSSGFTDQQAGIYGKKIFSSNVLDAGMQFNRDVYHYYGQPEIFPKSAYEKVRYADFNLHIGLNNSIASEDKLKYDFGLEYYNFSSKASIASGLSENDITILAKLTEPFNGSKISLNGSFDYMNLRGTATNNRTLLKIGGGYSTTLSGFRLHAGFNTASENDTLSKSRFHFYPDVRLEADLAGKYLMVFGGLTGDLEKNTYKNFVAENPFVNSSFQVRNTDKKFELYGGIKGSLSSKTSYLVSTAFKNYKNLYFYMNPLWNIEKFIPVYDSATTTVLSLNAELGFSPIENLSLNMAVGFNQYGLSTLARPYHRPAIEWVLTGNYNIQDKIWLGTEIFLLSTRYAGILDTALAPVQLKPVLDINASLTYALRNVKGLRIFLEFRNITANKYYLWNLYPSRGFQIVGGLKMSFL